MVEEQKQRLEEALAKLMNDVDQTYLRKMQGDMYRCAAKCCDDYSMPVEKAHACIETCSQPIQHAQSYVQGEMNHLQDRLQRCVMQCNDEIKDKMGPNPNDSEAQRYTQMFEKCATKCVDTHLDLIPKLMSRMKQVLAKQKQS
ncbi:protein FAM136A-like [Bacillus rossius redtenbacheri]|uniref:protein FAM136A-like n=1 Tax=Bacillus rossius redtenbacheri TaxID=93214 RepID=UPI002FDEBAA7